jgi:serine/threonine protein kinase
MAPEIIERKYDFQCDIWAAGVVMYFLLSGSFPFSGSSLQDIIAQIKTQPISFEKIVWGQVSELSKDLISKMLVKNPVIRLSPDLALKHQIFHKIHEDY